MCYKPRHVGIKEHYTVNHTNHEWSRPEPAVLSSVETKETAPGMAGTMLLDSTWGRIKGYIPAGLSVDSEGARRLKFSYIQAAQWRLILGTEDRWSAFCKVVNDKPSSYPT